MQDLLDLDTQKKIRYVSESSNTSGYSTVSPGSANAGFMCSGNQSPASSNFSATSSPAQSPASMLQTEFSQLNLPSTASRQYIGLSNISLSSLQSYGTNHYTNFSTTGVANALPQNQYIQSGGLKTRVNMKEEYPAVLRIIEHPVEKFRFRYKSEMHGTHGSLNGANSRRTPKTFPEVQLCNYNGNAIIRCSLFQTNLDSPHSHQLVVRKDDVDICDPHTLHVSPEHGFVAQFQNMGIIHTAKKFIEDELFKKKKDRLLFELGHTNLSTKQLEELRMETKMEAKDMNLNQVRLCFEAFSIENDNTYRKIAAPVYTNPINNRKSAQTGELRICRLSLATGLVTGGDELILLVEKVSKKNIKVRFFEMNEDEEIIWEAFGKFRESDVHHQYAIVCQTPPYMNKDIDKPVEVCVELLRPSDDERSVPVKFRYKPRDAIASRKRRRTCSTATTSSGSSSSLSSCELPKTLQDQTMTAMPTIGNGQSMNYYGMHNQTISEEFNKENELRKLIGSEEFREIINTDSEELRKLCTQNIEDFALLDDLELRSDGHLERDGLASCSFTGNFTKSMEINNGKVPLKAKINSLFRIFKIYDEARSNSNLSVEQLKNAGKIVSDIFCEYADRNERGDTLVHEVIYKDNSKFGIKLFDILDFFQIQKFCNRSNNYNENGLHYACLADRPHFIRPLLRRGCDPNAQDDTGNTPLHIAVHEQHRKCVESFLHVDEIRFNLTLKNDKGLTALHEAIRLMPDIAAKLLKQDKSVAYVIDNKNGNNALHMAVLAQNLMLIQLIIIDQDTGNILRSRNAAGQTALDLAKNLDTEEGEKIFQLLAKLCKEFDDKIVIKEEEMSSSSADEDEDSSSIEPYPDCPRLSEPLELIMVKKEEIDIDDSSSRNLNTTNNKLTSKLNDEEVFENLKNYLNENNKWRKLADILNLNDFLFLWKDAESMLNYVKSHSSECLNWEQFVSALEKVDTKALLLLKT